MGLYTIEQGKSVNNKLKEGQEAFSGITEGRFICIDPGTKYMGWSVVTVRKSGEAMLDDRGTIIRTGLGTGSTVRMVQEVFSIVENTQPDGMVVEDYMLIPGRTKGVFAVPALIGVLKYEWYRRTGKEVITVPARVWKAVVCRSHNAKKIDVREALKGFIDTESYNQIVQEFSEVRGKHSSDYGEQDCIDAVAIGLYVCLMILNEQHREEVSIV